MANMLKFAALIKFFAEILHSKKLIRIFAAFKHYEGDV